MYVVKECKTGNMGIVRIIVCGVLIIFSTFVIINNLEETEAESGFFVYPFSYTIIDEDERIVSLSGCDESYSGQLKIETTVTADGKEYSVVRISDTVFRQNTNLTGDLIIPEGIIEIAEFAFTECTEIKGKLQLPKSLKVIGTAAFAESGITGSIILPEGLETLSPLAFARMEGITDVELPDSITVLENACFNKSSIKTIRFGSNVKAINNDCFAYTKLQGTLELPTTLESIGIASFYECNGITKLIIPGSIRSMENGTFSDCKNLNSIYIKYGANWTSSMPFGNLSFIDSGMNLTQTPKNLVGYTFNKVDGKMIRESSDSYIIKLTANRTRGGTLIGSGTYAADSQVEIRYQPSGPLMFYEWNDGNRDLSRNVTVDRNIELECILVDKICKINAITPEQGSLEVDKTEALPGDEVSFIYRGWVKHSGPYECEGVKITDSTGRIVKVVEDYGYMNIIGDFRMPKDDVDISAILIPNVYTLEVYVSEGGYVEYEPGDYPYGTWISFIPHPDKGKDYWISADPGDYNDDTKMLKTRDYMITVIFNEIPTKDEGGINPILIGSIVGILGLIMIGAFIFWKLKR